MKPRPIRASHRPDKTEEPRRKIYSNFDVVSLDGYDMDWEDVTTYVHVSDD
jgi:hypothetical protein